MSITILQGAPIILDLTGFDKSNPDTVTKVTVAGDLSSIYSKALIMRYQEDKTQLERNGKDENTPSDTLEKLIADDADTPDRFRVYTHNTKTYDIALESIVEEVNKTDEQSFIVIEDLTPGNTVLGKLVKEINEEKSCKIFTSRGGFLEHMEELSGRSNTEEVTD